MNFKDLNKEEFRVNVQCGFTDGKLARLYGVSDKTISRWRKALELRSHWAPERVGHGTTAEYARGCRCAPCRAANTESHSAAIVKMRTAGLSPDDNRHGTYAAYTQWGCRCEPCRAEGRRKYREYQVGLREGTNPRRWTASEDGIVRTRRPAEAARLMGRSLNAIYTRRRTLRITKPRT